MTEEKTEITIEERVPQLIESVSYQHDTENSLLRCTIKMKSGFDVVSDVYAVEETEELREFVHSSALAKVYDYENYLTHAVLNHPDLVSLTISLSEGGDKRTIRTKEASRLLDFAVNAVLGQFDDYDVEDPNTEVEIRNAINLFWESLFSEETAEGNPKVEETVIPLLD
jgi:hypothetical protein